MNPTAPRVPRSVMNPARIESEARDRAQIVLGAISLVIWFAVAFTLAVRWFIDEYTPQPILMAGGVAFAIAALPWLAYRPLVRRFARRQRV